jgi:hypothetical protein
MRHRIAPQRVATVELQGQDAAEKDQDAFPFVEGYLFELSAQGSQVVLRRRPGWRMPQCLYKHTRTPIPTTPTRMEDERM